VNDPWKSVAQRTKRLLASASTAEDPRGAFVGLGLRFPDGVRIQPLLLEAAVRNQDFQAQLVALLACWGIVSDLGPWGESL
jgi:hypothetical protein